MGKCKTKSSKRSSFKYPLHATATTKSITIASPKQQHQVPTQPPKVAEVKEENTPTIGAYKLNIVSTTDLLASKGYFIQKKLADTLQGQIYRCSSNRLNKCTVVIKVTRKDLHAQKLTILEDG